jgi:hypothetical protein
MKVIEVRNVNRALHEGLWLLHTEGIKEPSRNGPVLVAPCPVATVYAMPQERVMLDPLRDCNPYFHLTEALWMLGGRRDVQFVNFFNSNIGQYSDDGVVFHGAYGHRWRSAFGYDQLRVIIDELRSNPESRRCVLAMWDASGPLSGEDDLHKAMSGGKDVPCNTHAYFRVSAGRLHITVCCRSNDVIWGAYGANAVQFSMLQEYVAAALGMDMGTYTQISNNYHMYMDTDVAKRLHAPAGDGSLGVPCPEMRRDYEREYVEWTPLMADCSVEEWDRDLERFLSDPAGDTAYSSGWFEAVAAPIYASWADRKAKKNDGLLALQSCAASDWALACAEWTNRRKYAKERT